MSVGEVLETDQRIAASSSFPLVGLTIVVPTRNERDNIAPLVHRLMSCVSPEAEILFVDDSDDDTPTIVARLAKDSDGRVRLLHRPAGSRAGGLSGAVTAGLSAARGRFAVVMDGDLQHPPELVPELHALLESGDTSVAVASRYRPGGSSAGLDRGWRHTVSSASTVAARVMFPRRVGRQCTDPMTGFFGVDREALDIEALRPQGFKILLEILARQDLKVREVPLTFGERQSGDSKANWREGVRFLRQLAQLRLASEAIRFALVGLFGFVLNLGITAALMGMGVHYLVAALIGSEITIVGNFLLQERFVFDDRRGRRWWVRFAHTMTLNNVELLVRVPLLALLVDVVGLPPLVALALAIAVGFVARFLFLTRVTYRRSATSSVETAVPLSTLVEVH